MTRAEAEGLWGTERVAEALARVRRPFPPPLLDAVRRLRSDAELRALGVSLGPDDFSALVRLACGLVVGDELLSLKEQERTNG